MKKYRVIDAWKGIFCILIFFEHFGICGLDGNTGYDVVECFFVISGFLLAKSIDARKGDFDILPYIFHKIKGIYPMYLWGMLLMFFYQLLPFCSEEFPSFYQIITELLLLQKSGLGVGNILNGADWYVSAYILSSAVILLGMKAVQNYYLRAAVSAAVVLHYLTYMIQFGNYNDAYAFGLLDGQLVRGIACMLIGIGTYQIYGLLSNHKVRVNQGIINLLEMILAFSFFLCIFDRSIEMVNVKILFIVVGLIVCAAYECGFVSKLISRGGGGLWKLSTAVYLTHLFSGNVFNGVFQWVNFKRELYVLAITVWVFVFAYISKVITERYFHMESINNFAVSIKHLWDGNGKYVAVFAYVIVCFCLQGANAWAEVVAEYMPYANGASFQSSFAGYITLFPVIVAVIWNQIVSGTGIPYVVFTCMVSLLYTLLCVYAVLKVLKGKNENRIMVLLPLLAVISHPSVQSIINITHLGYLPLAVHIFCCAKREHMPDEIVDISGGYFISGINFGAYQQTVFAVPVIYICDIYNKVI